MTHTRLHHHSARGYILFTLTIIVVLLGGVSAALLQHALGERTDLERQETSLRALVIAETGAYRAESEIGSGIDADADGLGRVSGAYGGGSYQATATEDPSDPRRWTVEIIGMHGLSRRRIEIGLLQSTGTLFPYAMFAKDLLELGSGGSTDSYDSRLGPWSTQITASDSGGPYAEGGNAHIGSNGTIKISEGTVIRGDARPGPGNVTEKGTVWGSRLGLDEPLDVPFTPIEEFQAAKSGNSNGNLDTAPASIEYTPAIFKLKIGVNGDFIMPGGTYFFTDFLVGGNSRVIVQGPTRIYATGQVLLGGKVQVSSGRAQDLLFFNHPYDIVPGFVPTGKDFKHDMGISAEAPMGIYAPALHMEVKSSGHMYGAVVARSVKFGGKSDWHYDRSLMEVSGGGTARMRRIYWREIGAGP
jgi:hypothetical protein